VHNPAVTTPRFWALNVNIKSQADYANLTFSLICSLEGKNIHVGTICTDGLPCQVNAINGKYQGFIFQNFVEQIFFFEGES
jgi:hypothetical protein